MATSILINILRIRSSSNILLKRWKTSEKRVSLYDPFALAPKKDKKTYIQAVKVFETRDTRRRGHVEFIYAALARMKEFGVNKDLDSYKALLDVLPKAKFIPENIFQAEFMHYPKQQQCAVDLLEQMEDNSELPFQLLFRVPYQKAKRRPIAVTPMSTFVTHLQQLND